MKLPKRIKFSLFFAVISIGLLGIFQNFTQNFAMIQMSQQRALASKNLGKISIPNLYANCDKPGTVDDKRPSDNQYNCTEYPLGLTNIGYSPQAVAIEKNKTSCSIQNIGRGRCNANCTLPNGIAVTCSTSYSDLNNSRPLSCKYETSRTRLGRGYSIKYDYVTIEAGTYRTNAIDLDSQLAQWNSTKTLFDQNLPFTDKAGKSRSVRLIVTTPRNIVSSTANVVVGNPAIGMKNYGKQVINKPSGHHFYNLNKDNATISGCTLFPGMKVYGHTVSSDYTIFEHWWGSYSITFTINPGSFGFDRLETCNLLKINPSEQGTKKVSLIGLKAPKFIAAKLSGLYFNIDIGIFGWFMVTLLAGLALFIPGIGPAVGIAILTSAVLICETNVPAQMAQNYINKKIDSYDSTSAWDKLLNNIDTSQANIKTGGYIKDVTTMGLLRSTVVPAIKEQMNLAANQVDSQAILTSVQYCPVPNGSNSTVIREINKAKGCKINN